MGLWRRGRRGCKAEGEGGGVVGGRGKGSEKGD